jgi:hypothetical protein
MPAAYSVVRVKPAGGLCNRFVIAAAAHPGPGAFTANLSSHEKVYLLKPEHLNFDECWQTRPETLHLPP